MMSKTSVFYSPDSARPGGIDTDRLHLEPLKPEHAAIDFEAVTASREQLRLWSGTEWPADDFTLADNLKDLQWHWDEHQKGLAFTYTVLHPARGSCLGCVYIRPVRDLAPYNEGRLDQVAPDEAMVSFWVRSSELVGDLETHLLQTILDWLDDSWPFSHSYMMTRPANERQARLFTTCGLQPQLTLNMPGRERIQLFDRA